LERNISVEKNVKKEKNASNDTSVNPKARDSQALRWSTENSHTEIIKLLTLAINNKK